MLVPGSYVINRYEIIAKIGSGGMADVYKAKDHVLNRLVAIKVLKQEYSTDATFVKKFRVEAQSAAGLSHPNIVSVYDVGEDDGVYFIVMELVQGITLKNYIDMKGKLDIREALNISVQIASGLSAAHENRIIHRDIKPQNIIMSRDGKVKVTDFGIAKVAAIYEGVQYNDKLRVCFDTCHVHDAGYDIVHDFSGVMTQFDKVIGQDQIAVFHVNDSKNPCGAHKDRHENFGFGEIGFEALMQVVNCPDFEQIPKILETPYIPDAENKKKSYAPYKFEIEMIRKGLFDAQLKEKILQAAK